MKTKPNLELIVTVTDIGKYDTEKVERPERYGSADIDISIHDGCNNLGTYNGYIRGGIIFYLHTLWSECSVPYPVGIPHENLRQRIYKCFINELTEEIQEICNAIVPKFEIVPRNETVNRIDFLNFFGSSDSKCWAILIDPYYKPGTFLETLEVTLDYMQKGNLDFYYGTNVPRGYLLKEEMGMNPEFEKYAKLKIIPLVEAFWKSEKKIEPSWAMERFKEIIDVTKLYQNGKMNDVI